MKRTGILLVAVMFVVLAFSVGAAAGNYLVLESSQTPSGSVITGEGQLQLSPTAALVISRTDASTGVMGKFTLSQAPNSAFGLMAGLAFVTEGSSSTSGWIVGLFSDSYLENGFSLHAAALFSTLAGEIGEFSFGGSVRKVIWDPVFVQASLNSAGANSVVSWGLGVNF